MTTDLSQAIPLCPSGDLQEGGLAVPFDVVYAGQTCRAFAIRFHGGVHAYLNRCAHVPMEMDYQENRFFDDSSVPRTALPMRPTPAPAWQALAGAGW